jgi:hypothetical protein
MFFHQSKIPLSILIQNMWQRYRFLCPYLQRFDSRQNNDRLRTSGLWHRVLLQAKYQSDPEDVPNMFVRKTNLQGLHNVRTQKITT